MSDSMADRDSDEVARALKPIIWTTTFEMGDGAVDAEHKQFIEIVNRLTASIRANAETSTISALCDEVVAHSAAHFRSEEAAMARYGYENLKAHRQDHERLLADITRVSMALRHSVDRATLVDQALTIKELLLRHLFRMDVQYKSHFMAMQRS
jgi:hemerythrin-like metal-binding protein